MRFQVPPLARLGARASSIAVACALAVGTGHVADAIPEDPYPIITVSSTYDDHGDDWQEDYLVHEVGTEPSVASHVPQSVTDPLSHERHVLQLILTTLRFSIR